MKINFNLILVKVKDEVKVKFKENLDFGFDLQKMRMSQAQGVFMAMEGTRQGQTERCHMPGSSQAPPVRMQATSLPCYCTTIWHINYRSRGAKETVTRRQSCRAALDQLL